MVWNLPRVPVAAQEAAEICEFFQSSRQASRDKTLRASEECRLGRYRRLQAEVPVGKWRDDTALRRPFHEADLDEIGFVDLFDSLGFFANSNGE